MTVIPLENLRIHTYEAPEAAVFVNSHILETEHGLIVIDTQFLRPHAEDFRRYADSLGKPIDRVIITHSHPDHWFGCEYFRDAPIYALAEVADQIRGGGEAMIQAYAPVFGDAITETVVVPERTIRPGTETLDGVTLAYEKADAAEAGVNLVIELPENRVLIAQDLVYNRVHVFLQQKEMGPWLAHLRRFQEKEYDFVLSGHGLPANMQALADMAGYLEDAKSALAASSDVPTLKQHLVGKYPSYRGEMLLDISGRYLYGT
jgi:glyoxylase-like metal-dependent hydrolase (beta-lactamase superfamily II)